MILFVRETVEEREDGGLREMEGDGDTEFDPLGLPLPLGVNVSKFERVEEGVYVDERELTAVALKLTVGLADLVEERDTETQEDTEPERVGKLVSEPGAERLGEVEEEGVDCAVRDRVADVFPLSLACQLTLGLHVLREAVA